MRCLSPIKIRHPTKEGEFIVVPCGKCVACLSRRRQQWVFRLQQELKFSMSANFITLTYDDDHVNWSDDPFTHMCLCKRDVQLWLKRLRKYITKHYDEPVTLRYFLVGEYGDETARPHYHVLLFNFPTELNLLVALNETWTNGLVHVGTVTDKSISYTVKYTLKFSRWEHLEPKPFMLCSKSIGLSYLTPETIHYFRRNLIGYVTLPSGKTVRLPRYYKEKVFDEDEKLQLTNQLRDWLLNQELDYIKKYNDIDMQALEAGTAMMKTQMDENYIKSVERNYKKNRKL